MVRKWTRWHEFKSCTRLFAFYKTQIRLWKLGIQIFTLQLWVNSRADCFGIATSLRERKIWTQTYSALLKIDIVSHLAGAEGLVYIFIWSCIFQNKNNHIYQPLRSGKIWHKVNFSAEFNRFEFRVFLLD